ncbi:MAG: site-2 protease family protein [Candidatus Hodarchaeales archaeon]|jgi:membrane-associated protease RseP (regulator of RpoE activity)
MDFFSFIIIIGGSWLILSTISVASLKYFNLKNPEIGLGYIMLRTTKVNAFINAIAGRGKLFWQLLFDTGIIVSIGVLLAAIFMFGTNMIVFILKLLVNVGVIPDNGGVPQPIEVTPAIPGLTISLEILPYFFIAILISAGFHELFHGIAARVGGIELKSTGLIFFLIFFAAFVEPDEKSLKSAPVRDRLRVYASGALANVFITLLLLILLLPPVFQFQADLFAEDTPSGAMFVNVVPNSPAFDAGFRPGNVITGIYNGTLEDKFFAIDNSTAFHNFTVTTRPGQDIIIQFLAKGNLEFTLGTHPSNESRGYLGVLVNNYFAPKYDFLPLNAYSFYYNVLVYTSSISLMLALLNLLPMPPLDGSKMIEDYLKTKGVPMKFVRAIQIGSIVILLGNIILTFLVSGLVVF